jgi:hypothetical protein
MHGPTHFCLLRCVSDSVCWCCLAQHSRVARVPMTNIQRTLHSKKIRRPDPQDSVGCRSSGLLVHIFPFRRGSSR